MLPVPSLFLIIPLSHEHVNVVVIDKIPLFFNQRDGPYFPTLRLLHKCPALSFCFPQISFTSTLVHLVCLCLLRSVDPSPLPNRRWWHQVYVFGCKCNVPRAHLAGRGHARGSCWNRGGKRATAVSHIHPDFQNHLICFCYCHHYHCCYCTCRGKRGPIRKSEFRVGAENINF